MRCVGAIFFRIFGLSLASIELPSYSGWFGYPVPKITISTSETKEVSITIRSDGCSTEFVFSENEFQNDGTTFGKSQLLKEKLSYKLYKLLHKHLKWEGNDKLVGAKRSACLSPDFSRDFTTTPLIETEPIFYVSEKWRQHEAKPTTRNPVDYSDFGSVTVSCRQGDQLISKMSVGYQFLTFACQIRRRPCQTSMERLCSLAVKLRADIGKL